MLTASWRNYDNSRNRYGACTPKIRRLVLLNSSTKVDIARGANRRYHYQRNQPPTARASDLRFPFGPDITNVQPSSPTCHHFLFKPSLVEADVAAVIDQKNVIFGCNGLEKTGRSNAEVLELTPMIFKGEHRNTIIIESLVLREIGNRAFVQAHQGIKNTAVTRSWLESLKNTNLLQRRAGPFPTAHKVMIVCLTQRAIFISKRLARPSLSIVVHLPINIEQKLVYERSHCRVSHSLTSRILAKIPR